MSAERLGVNDGDWGITDVIAPEGLNVVCEFDADGFVTLSWLSGGEAGKTYPFPKMIMKRR